MVVATSRTRWTSSTHEENPTTRIPKPPSCWMHRCAGADQGVTFSTRFRAAALAAEWSVTDCRIRGRSQASVGVGKLTQARAAKEVRPFGLTNRQSRDNLREQWPDSNGSRKGSVGSARSQQGRPWASWIRPQPMPIHMGDDVPMEGTICPQTNCVLYTRGRRAACAHRLDQMPNQPEAGARARRSVHSCRSPRLAGDSSAVQGGDRD